jgi:predicted ester cyclase
MSIEEENKTLLYRIFDLLNKGELTAYYELFDNSYVAHVHGRDIPLEELKKIDAGLFALIPDYHFKLNDIIAENDKIAFRATCWGTHTGESMGIAPTGKKLEFVMFCISRFYDGKVDEDWILTDLQLMMQQLGVMPS